MNVRVTSILLVILCVAAAAPALAVSVGQVDDFETGTTMGWTIGVGNISPGNVANGGPAGAGDNYLQSDSSGGFGARNRQVIFNRAQWTGDFLAEGVVAVTADVRNLGNTSLSLRLALDTNTANGTAGRIVSTNAVEISAQSDWQNVTFATTPDALTALSASSVESTLSSVADFRFYHSPSATFPGPSIASMLGLDNITAVGAAMPTPADFDDDGDVDRDDFFIWQASFGESGTTSATGDADGNGTTDGKDFLIWQARLGTTSAGGASPVPEPGTTSLLLLLGILLALHERRRGW